MKLKLAPFKVLKIKRYIFTFALFVNAGCQSLSTFKFGDLECSPWPHAKHDLATTHLGFIQESDRFFAITKNRKLGTYLYASQGVRKKISADQRRLISELHANTITLDIGVWKGSTIAVLLEKLAEDQAVLKIFPLLGKERIIVQSKKIEAKGYEYRAVVGPKKIWILKSQQAGHIASKQPWEIYELFQSGEILNLDSVGSFLGEPKVVRGATGELYLSWLDSKNLASGGSQILISSLKRPMQHFVLSQTHSEYPVFWDVAAIDEHIFIITGVGDSIAGTSGIRIEAHSKRELSKVLWAIQYPLEDWEAAGAQVFQWKGKIWLTSLLWSGSRGHIGLFELSKKRLRRVKYFGPINNKAEIRQVLPVSNSQLYYTLKTYRNNLPRAAICAYTL